MMTGLEMINNPQFSDISGHWAEDDIMIAAQYGWVTGYSDGTFRPNQPITRAEFMTLTNRVLGRVLKSAEDLIPGEMRTWSDNMNTNAWYYLAVQEATNSSVPDYYDDFVPGLNFEYKAWKEMLDTPDWAALERGWASMAQGH